MLTDAQEEDAYEKLAERIFTMIDETKLSIPSDTQLEIGLRNLKTKFDEGGVDYREKLFGLPAKDKEDEFEQF